MQTSLDELDEPTEEFSVELSSPNGATLSKRTGTGTITDGDEPTLSIEDATAVVEGGTAEFVVGDEHTEHAERDGELPDCGRIGSRRNGLHRYARLFDLQPEHHAADHPGADPG